MRKLRPTCSDCAKKHLAQATILLSEAKRGYPTHRLLALGHLAEAEEELVGKFPKQAGVIRGVRKKMETNPKFSNDMMGLIKMVDDECDECSLNTTVCPSGQKFDHQLGKCR